MLRLMFAGSQKELAAKNRAVTRDPRPFPAANRTSYINNAVAAARFKLAFPF
jgi:hypothetical protein